MDNKKRLYKIGDIAKRFSVSVQTLRFYERIGIFVPSVIDEETGYRYYTSSQFERLRLIIFLKDFDLSLKAIKDLIDSPSEEGYINELERYSEMLDARIREDTAQKKHLDEKIATLKMARNLPQNKVLFLTFPAQRVIRYDRAITYDDDSELAIADFINKCNLSPGIGRIGQLFSPKQLIQNDKIVSTSMYVHEELCLGDIIEDENIHKDVFPSGVYATMYYQKRTEQSLPFMYELIDEAKRCSFALNGNIIRSIVFDVGDCEKEGSGYLACIRVLVSKK